MKVAVIGAAGGIGQALALLLKNRLPAGSDLALYDIAPVTPGVAVDLSISLHLSLSKVIAVKIHLQHWKVLT